MSDEAITVTNEVSINHWEMGRTFWQWDNEEQAQFLHGLYTSMWDLGGLYGVQLLAILDHAKAEGFEMDLAELTAILKSHLTPEATK